VYGVVWDHFTHGADIGIRRTVPAGLARKVARLEPMIVVKG